MLNYATGRTILLFWSFLFIRGENVTYDDFVKQYEYIFKNYQPPNQKITLKTYVHIENIFDIQLTQYMGSVKIFAYSCYYWKDPNLPTWKDKLQFKLRFYTFVYKEKKCPLKVPKFKNSVPNTHVSIRNDGYVFMCPHASHKLTCFYTAHQKESYGSYTCMHYRFPIDYKDWDVTCGSWTEWNSPSNKSTSDHCYEMTTEFYSDNYFMKKTSEWKISNITKTMYKNYMTLIMIELQSTKKIHYINKILVALTVGILSSSILLIPFYNKSRILISVLLLFAMNIWIRYRLAEDASIQYGYSEDLMKFCQSIYYIQLIVLLLSTVTYFLTSKLNRESQPPEIILKFYGYIRFIGHIDPQLKKQNLFINGILLSLNMDTKADNTKQLQNSIDALKIGWPEITLVLDRLGFIILFVLVCVSSTIFL